jgi:DNA replication protein DnaC
MATKTASRNVTAELAFLTRALKAPSLAAAVERLAQRARAESWSHEEFLAACLQREVAAREAHGGEGRIRAARFPARKSLEEFDFDHQRSLKRETRSGRPLMVPLPGPRLDRRVRHARGPHDRH